MNMKNCSSRAIYFFFTMFVVVLISLTSCGGGGGGGGALPTGGGGNNGGSGGGGGVTEQSVNVNGSVSYTVSSSPSVRGAAAVGNQNNTSSETIGPVDNAIVKISSYNNKDKVIDTVTTSSTDKGLFSAQIKTVSNGGYLVISIKKDGYTEYSKTITYNSPSEIENLNIKALLDAYLTEEIPVPSSLDLTDLTASSVNNQPADTISIAVVQDKQGNKSITSFTNSRSASSLNNSSDLSNLKVIWQMDLPARRLAASGIKTIKINIKNYDPADQNDSKRFPSEIDASGNRLASTGFDYVEIKTDTGEPLTLSGASIDAQAAVQDIRVKRLIENCSLITCDADPNTPGVQVGFYFLRDGKWNLLGYATLYNDSNRDGIIEDTERLDDPAFCSEGSTYAVLTGTDVIMDYLWYNLDYVAAGCVQKSCVSGKVEYGDGSPVKYISLELTDISENSATIDGFRGGYGYTDDSGNYSIEFVHTQNSLSQTPTVTIEYPDPFTFYWKTKTIQASGGTDSSNRCYDLGTLVITNPYKCKVTGTVVRNGSAVADRLVQAIPSDDSFYGVVFGITDSNGQYNLDVLCNQPYNLMAGSEQVDASFNVDGNIDIDEDLDDGTIVTMKPINLQNTPPEVYAYSDFTSLLSGGNTYVYAWGFDPDGDPITYSWSDNCGGTFSDSSASIPQWTAPQVNQQTECQLTVTASDGNGTGSANIIIYVSPDNRPPVIQGLYGPSVASSGKTYNVFVNAYDPDGDTISYNWSDDCGGIFSDSSISNSQWTAPVVQNVTSCNISITVDDGNNQPLQQSIVINVYANKAPTVAINANVQISKGTDTVLYSYTFDPDNDPLTYTWSDDCNGTFSDNTAENPTWTAPSIPTSCTITLTVSDGQNTQQATYTISVINNPPQITIMDVPSSAHISETINFTAEASDQDNDALTFLWSDNCGGTFSDSTAQSPSWTAPDTKVICNITLTVSDGYDQTQLTKAISVGNNPPEITSFNVPDTANLGETVTLSIDATDPDGDSLSYSWYINNVLVSNDSSFDWTPDTNGSIEIKVVVSDGFDTTEELKTVTVSGQTGIDVIIQ